MTNKELLLSKIYDDNTLCYRIDNQRILVRNQENKFLADWYLNSEVFWLSYSRIWRDFESKTGGNPQEISDLTGGILGDHLKRKGLTTPVLKDSAWYSWETISNERVLQLRSMYLSNIFDW